VVLKIVGISGPNWLTNSAYTKLSLIIIGAWGSGQIMIIFLASLQDVPKSLYEAAEIDGASVWKKFLNITLPGISPIIFFQLIMGVIANLQYFTQAYIIASVTSGGGLNSATGGPENSLLFYALYLYQNGFVYFKMGTASAMAWILFVIVAAITWLVFKSSAKWVTYGGE
jgi:multiple sugar transport system permease protein